MIKYFKNAIRFLYDKAVDEEPMTETQILGNKILLTMLEAPDAKLTIAPISSTYYVQWNDIFAKIGEFRVQIVNGVYFYDILLSARQSEELRNIFDLKLEAKRKDMENTIMDKTNRSLKIILAELESTISK